MDLIKLVYLVLVDVCLIVVFFRVFNLLVYIYYILFLRGNGGVVFFKVIGFGDLFLGSFVGLVFSRVYFE